ncbi:hypothetical protein ACFL0D_08280 [Thermoproteota archaeon]
MKLNRIQLASVLTLFMLFTAPSLAFPGDLEPSCYQAELFYDGLDYGKVKLMVSSNENLLEVEVEEFMHPGKYSVQLFKDYYSDFVAGMIEINEDGNGKAVFEIPFHSPDFTVNVENGEYVLASGEWIECEKTVKSVEVKVSPSTLNLKSMGKWVTVKITIPTDDPMPSDFKMYTNGDPIEPESIKISKDHVILKFSRADLQEMCDEGEVEVKLSFKMGDQTIELSDTIRVINKGNKHEETSTRGNSEKTKSNNGKAKGKNKNN